MQIYEYIEEPSSVRKNLQLEKTKRMQLLFFEPILTTLIHFIQQHKNVQSKI